MARSRWSLLMSPTLESNREGEAPAEPRAISNPHSRLGGSLALPLPVFCLGEETRMSRVQPLPESEAVDKVAQTYGRIKELFEADAVPEPFLTYGRVPAFLQDFYMNFKKFVWNAGKLDEKTKAIIALAVSTNGKCDVWADRMAERLKALGGTDQQVADTLAVAATCGMYNIFFKFRDISGSDIFGGMSVGLRAHTFANTTLDDKTVELINIAISDINGCKPCTSGHVEKARQLGLKDEEILEAIQCAATMSAGAAFLSSAGV